MNDTTNETGHENLATALAAAQAELADPARNKEAKIPGRGGYRYAGLDDLLKAVRPVLSRHGLCVAQGLAPQADGEVWLETRILHGPSDQAMVSLYPMDWRGKKPQDRGSELTYARRYSLEAMVGVAATDDNDAADVPAPLPPVRHTHWSDTDRKRWCAGLSEEGLGLHPSTFARWMVEGLNTPHPCAWTEQRRAQALAKLRTEGPPEAFIEFMNREDPTFEAHLGTREALR